LTNPLELTQALIQRESVTPIDGGCQDLLCERLQAKGFTIERLRFGDVDNFWARKGDASPLLCFAGHTDVVPPGPLENWVSNRFTPTVRDGHLFGRGAADMKSGLACMVTAAESFVENNPNHSGSIAFLVTSDEEGPSINGTVKLVEHLQARNEPMDYCIVGEASSIKQLGDMAKIGRRGSLLGHLSFKGKQGHIAYPKEAINPNHLAIAPLAELINTEWDQGNDCFQPTSFQISNITGGTGATNVIPGTLEVMFNFRYSTECTAEQLQARVEEILKSHNVPYDIKWHISGRPFLTKQGQLIEASTKAIQEVCNLTPELSTTGGTSDGRFIAPTGTEVIEIGPINKTIHQIDECVKVEDLERLKQIYYRILEHLLV